MDYLSSYDKVLKYAASETTKQLLGHAIQHENRDDVTTHGAIADSLDESGESPQLAHLIRKHYGLSGEPVGMQPYFGLTQLAYRTNAPAHSMPIGSDENFAYHLSHESDPAFQHWQVHAVSKMPGVSGSYSFHYPHNRAHEIPQLFPEAAEHINPVDLAQHTVLSQAHGQRVVSNNVYRNREGIHFEHHFLPPSN